MPANDQTPAGEYQIVKRFRYEENVRHKKDLPWRKQLLDLDKNRFFSRTPWEWCRIILFYLLLYFLIALICGIYALVFHFIIIDPKRPCVLKDQPGLSVIPRTSSTFHSNIPAEIYPIADVLDNFISKLKGGEKFTAACNVDTLWGYRDQTPCVFVKLNKVIGFKAKTYDSEDELPSSAAQNLPQVMKDYPGQGRIWLTCETKGSKVVQLNYTPGPYYDTTTNMEGANRVVALQFVNLPENERIHVTCKIWAKNIDIDEVYTGRGHAKFSIHMLVKY